MTQNDTAEATPNVKKMRGSEGRLDYHVFGQRNGIALGVKLLDLRPLRSVVGESVEKERAVVRLRVRSARLADSAEDTNVVALNMPLDKAWPSFEFINVSHKRASTMFLYPFRMDLTDPQNVADVLGTLQLGRKVARTLLEKVEPAFHAVAETDLAEVFNVQFETLRKSALAAVEHQKKMAEFGAGVGDGYLMNVAALKSLAGPAEDDTDSGDAPGSAEPETDKD